MNNYAVEDWNPIHLFPRELPGSRPLPTSIYGVTPVIDPVSLCGSASGSSIRCLTQCPLPCDHSCISIFFPYLGVLLLFGGFLIFFSGSSPFALNADVLWDSGDLSLIFSSYTNSLGSHCPMFPKYMSEP